MKNTNYKKSNVINPKPPKQLGTNLISQFTSFFAVLIETFILTKLYSIYSTAKSPLEQTSNPK
jgi:hypothetical protein